MASSLRVNAIIPSSGTNVAIGTAGGTITYNANVTGVSTFSSNIVVSAGSSIGIGTANPQQILHLSASSPNILLQGTSYPALKYAGADGVVDAEMYYGAGGGNDLVVHNYNSGPIIFNTNSTERLRIDSSGRVTKPNQPSFCASKNNTEQTTSGTIVFNLDSGAGRHNIGGHYSTSTGTFTAPIAGRYVFMCSIHSTNGTYRVDVRLRINGNDAPGGFALNNIDAFTQATGCAVLNLAANDAVTIYNNNAGVWYDAGLTYFSGYLLG